MIKKLKEKLKKRKKGGVAIIGGTLLLILALTMLAFIFINIFMVYETLNRAIDAVEEGARIRAQAIDMPLKESYGLVESFHKYGGSSKDNISLTDDLIVSLGNVLKDVNASDYQDRTDFVSIPGHIKITPAYYHSNTQYKQLVDNADEEGKAAIVNYVNYTIGMNANNNRRLLSVHEDNICFDVQPIPIAHDFNAPGELVDVTFSCELYIPGKGWETVTETRKIPNEKAERYVTVIQTDINGDGEYDDIRHYQVKNVVFVAAAVEYDAFMINLFDNIIENFEYMQPDPKIITHIAFPQVDDCPTATICEIENYED